MARGIEITEIRIQHAEPSDDPLKAYASITLNGVFVIHNLKIMQGDGDLFVSMPARRNRDGRFSDIVHPITTEFRLEVQRAVLAAYHGEDWRPPASGVVAWVRPPPDDLLGRAALDRPNRRAQGGAR